MVRGEPLDVVDRRAQYPEGVDLRRDFTLGMPWTLGTLYRWLTPPVPVDVFVAYAQILISALTVLGVFGLARAIFTTTGAGLVAAAFYAVSTASMARSPGSFIHEDFAHPLITGALALLALGLSRSQIRFAVGAALLTIASLASWHFTQFLLLALAAGLIGALLLGRRLPLGVVATYVATVLVGTVVLPGLREQRIWACPALVLLVALTVFLTLEPRRGRKVALGSAILLLLGLTTVYAALGFEQQSHVFAIFVEKLRFGFVKPSDPSALSFETRSLWIEDENTPGWFSVLYLSSLYFPLALLGAGALPRRRWNAGFVVTAAMAAATLLLFLIARRLITTEIIWLSALIGGLTQWPGRTTRTALATLGALVLTFEVSKSFALNRNGAIERVLSERFAAESSPPLSTLGDQLDLVAWVRTQTGRDDAIVAPIGLSPVLLERTRRPIVLHSKWESKALRTKYQTYLAALFGRESDLAQFFRHVDAKFLVHDATTVVREGPDSLTYMAGRTSIDPDSAAYLFNYHPERLRNFRLIYENATYRVFSVHAEAAASPHPALLFDESLRRWRSHEKILTRLYRDRARMREAIEIMQIDPARAEEIFLALQREGVNTWDLEGYLCYTRMAANDLDGAERHCREELAVRPHSVTGRFHSGLLAELRGDPAGAQGWYHRTLESEPRFAPALERLTSR